MSRNRFTKLIRSEERVQLARQDKELRQLIRDLNRNPAGLVELPCCLDAKGRRRNRLEQNRQYRIERTGDVLDLRSP